MLAVEIIGMALVLVAIACFVEKYYMLGFLANLQSTIAWSWVALNSEL